MKLVILAGGLGTRIAEESETRPKPMVEIGNRPLLWHIMKIYAHYGVTEFIICLGYKGYMIKEFFINYQKHLSDLSINLKDGAIEVLQTQAEDWKVTLVDTGENTMTGGRLKRIAPYVADGPFCMTYGDGLSDIDLAAEMAFHRQHGKLATVAAVQPPGRFGVLSIEEKTGAVTSFQEKPGDEIGWINGGFFILDPAALDYIEDDMTSFEQGPLAGLARDGHLSAFKHSGFWLPCDTLRDKRELEKLWSTGRAPWHVWR